MTEGGILNFRLGENLGVTIQNLAWENLYCEYDLQKAVRTITGCGCPEQYVKDILEQKLFLDVTSDDMMGIFTELEMEERSKDRLSQFYRYDPDFITKEIFQSEKIDVGENLIKNFSRFFSGDERLKYSINLDKAEYIFDMPKDWHWEAHTTLSPLDIAKIYLHNDKKMMEILEQAEIDRCFGSPISNAFNDLMGLRNYVKYGVNIIKLYNSLFNKNDPYNKYAPESKKPTGFNKYYGIVRDLEYLLDILQELDPETIEAWTKLHEDTEINPSVESVIRTVDPSTDTPAENFEKFQKVHQKKNIVERDISEPVTWDHNWTAGFIDREGNIYAMDEWESRLAHMDIADALYEKNPNLPILDNNKDWSLDRLGWIRFHEGAIRYSGYYLVSCGYGMRDLPFTSRQKDRLAEYCKLFYPQGIYNEVNNKSELIKESDWNNWSDDEFRKIFEL